MKKALLAITGLFVLLGLYASVKAMLMGLQCHTGQTASALCSIATGDPSSCSPAICGSWGKILGVSNGTWGTVFHLFVAVTWIFALLRSEARDRLMLTLFGLSLAAVGYALFMATLLTFVVKVPCAVCITFYLGALGYLAGSFLYTRGLFSRGRFMALLEQLRELPRNREALVMAVVLCMVSAGLVGAMEMKNRTLMAAVSHASLDDAQTTALTRQQREGDVPLPTDEASRQWMAFLSPPLRDDLLPSPSPDLTYGNPAGTVTMYVFTDFECPHCRTTEGVLRELVKELPFLKVVRKDYPLDHGCNPILGGKPFHIGSCVAALFARCAGQQDQYWMAHDMIFEFGDALDRPETYQTLAKDLNLSTETLNACMNDEKGQARTGVQRDISEGNALLINGTPTVVINGRLVQLPTGPDDYRQIIKVMAGGRPDHPPSEQMLKLITDQGRLDR